MKKIKNIHELTAEKNRLKHRQAELEKAIKYDLRDVKESLKPGNIAAQVFSGIFEHKQQTGENGTHENANPRSAILETMAEKLLARISKWIRK